MPGIRPRRLALRTNGLEWRRRRSDGYVDSPRMESVDVQSRNRIHSPLRHAIGTSLHNRRNGKRIRLGQANIGEKSSQTRCKQRIAILSRVLRYRPSFGAILSCKYRAVDSPIVGAAKSFFSTPLSHRE